MIIAGIRPTQYRSSIQACLAAILLLCIHEQALAQRDQQSRQVPVSTLCDSGFVLLEKEDYAGAQQAFREALRLDRAYPRALYGIGRAFLELPKGTGRALDYLQRAAENMPDDIDVFYCKAIAHSRLAETEFIGRGNSRAAIGDLEKVLTINPSHHNAHFLIGELYRDYFKDYEQAIEAFRNQVTVHPDHVEAWQALLAAEIDTGNWETAVATAEDLLTRNPEMLEAYPWLAAAHWKAGRLDDSMRIFEYYFTALPEEEKSVYFDLAYILATVDVRDYVSLDEAGRDGYWLDYWRSHDPDPKTMINERLLEHFIRVAYARIEFGKKKWPWDSRGDFYIRYGEPDEDMGPGRPFPSTPVDEWEFYLKECELRDRMGLPRPVFHIENYNFILATLGFDTSVDGSSTPVRWLYTDEGIDVTFVNPVMSGNYLPGSGPLIGALKRHLPVLSEEEDKIRTFELLQSALTFRGRNGWTALEYSIGILEDHIGQFRSITGEYANINARMELFTTAWRPVAGAIDSVHHLELRPQVRIRGEPMFVHGTRLEVPPGDYMLSTLIMDAESGMRSINKGEVVLPDYSGFELMISDILPAAKITEVGPGRVGRFIRGDLEVIPLPGRNLGKDQPLFIYFEVYNLTWDLEGATRYRIEYAVAESRSSVAPLGRIYQGFRRLVGLGQRRAVLSSEFTQSDIRRDLSTYLEIDMSEPPHGVYELIVTITDLNSKLTASSGLTFRTLPMQPEPPNIHNYN